MNIQEELLIPEDKNYLSEVMNKLPSNVIFDKGLTGCGGTTLEIECDRHSIICVPYRNLITSKTSQHSHLIGVMGGVDYDDIRYRIKSTERNKEYIKVMCTYDSLKTVISLFPKTIDVYDEVFLLVDEYHTMLLSYNYRYKAINMVLNEADLFREVTYMSATPIRDERYIIDRLKKIPIYSCKWEGSIPIKIKGVEEKSVRVAVEKLIIKKLNGRMIGNLHFFYNSVRGIARTLRNLRKKGYNLDDSNVKVVCSINKDNQLKLTKRFPISDDLMTSKTINFYTSTAFEGADVFDIDGRTFIVSDPTAPHTIYDIAICIPQICGRIRDSKFKNEIVHIYHPTKDRYKIYNSSEFSEKVDERKSKGLKDINVVVTAWDKEDEDYRDSLIDRLSENVRGHGSLADRYVIYGDYVKGYITHSPELMSLDNMNYETIHQIYASSVKMSQKYNDEGIDYSKRDDMQLTTIDDIMSGRRPSFKKVYFQYAELMKQKDSQAKEDGISEIVTEYPLVIKAYDELSMKQIENCHFRWSNIEKKINKKYIFDDDILVNDIKNSFKLDHFYTNRDIKEKLQSLFIKYNKDHKCKASDINYWFITKSKQRVVNDIKSHGVIIKQFK